MAGSLEGFRSVKGIRRPAAGRVEVDFGAGPISLAASTRMLNLCAGENELVPADGPVDWTQLDALPELITLEWAGHDRGIIEAIATHPVIAFLYWHDAVGDIDLTATDLGTVRIDGADLRRIRLPESIRTLLLRRPPATLEVDAPNLGYGLDLRLFQYGPDVVIPKGLLRTSRLWLWVGDTVSATVLSGMTDLDDLRLAFDKPPGTITDLPELGRHHRLHTVQIDDGYGLIADDLPDLPALRTLELNGTRRHTATAVKARFKASAVAVSVQGAKSQGWLANHMDNPFRDWVQDSKAFGQAACTAYNRARRSVENIPTDNPDRLAAERILRGLVTDLNAINDRFHMIDTLYRDQAGDAYHELANRLQVPAVLAGRWFDDDRRF